MRVSSFEDLGCAEEAALFGLGQADLLDKLPFGYRPVNFSTSDPVSNVIRVGDYILVTGVKLSKKDGTTLGTGEVLAEVSAETPDLFILKPIKSSFPEAEITNSTVAKKTAGKEDAYMPGDVAVYRRLEGPGGIPLWVYIGGGAVALGLLSYFLFFRK